jgi:thiamine biosynthesis lipoprotein
MATRCQPLLGTFVEITAEDGAAIDAGFAAIARVHRLMSFHAEDSDLARLRREPAGMAVAIAPETADVLRLALELYHESGGVFDVAVGARLVRSGFLPCPDGVDPAACDGTSADLEVTGDGRAVCHRPLLIDLGGIAKGFAVDRAVAAMRAAGARGGLVNAGGDMRAFGPRAFVVEIRRADGRIQQNTILRGRALASTDNGGTRRRRWGRLVTPHIRFGRAIRSHGVTSVVAPDCATADALTKVALADRALAERMLARRGGFVLAPRQESADAA